MLETLRSAIRERRHAAALAMALELWRDRPCTELAAIVIGLGEATPPPADQARSPEALLEAPDPSRWPEVLEWLAQSTGSPKMLRNLEALAAAWPPDPRLTDWLFAFVSCPPWDLTGRNTSALAAVVVRLLAQSPDERVDSWMRELPSLFESRRGSRKGQLSKDEIATLDKLFRDAGLVPGKARSRATPSLSEEDATLLAELGATLTELSERVDPQSARRAQLLQAVIDHWDADEPKQVYADHLLEQGDPQGELIALELAAKATKKTSARINKLRREVAAKIGVPATIWNKGFPRGVKAWGAEGPTTTYGEELAWGTVESVDVPPSSDACHTESLRRLQVAVSYLGDLARLTKPLGVTHFAVLNPSHARTALKKVKVLPAVEHLELVQPSSRGDYRWVFTIPWLAAIHTLTFNTLPVRSLGEVAQRAAEYFVGAPELMRIVLQPEPHGESVVELERRANGVIHAILRAADDAKAEALVNAFAPLPRPSFDSLEVITPATMIEGLAGLGRAQTQTKTAAPPPNMQVVDDVLVIGPAPGEPVLDPTALHAALATAPRTHKLRASDVDLRWLARYLEACAGIDELWFSGRAQYANHVLHRTIDGWLELDLATYALPETLFDDLPNAKVRLRCNPNIDLSAITARFDKRGVNVEAIHDEQVRLRLFRTKYVKKARRLELNAGYASLTMPTIVSLEALRDSFLDGLTPKARAKLSIHELRVQVQELLLGRDLPAWLDWLERQAYPVAFQSSPQETSRFTPSPTGLEVALCLRHLGRPEAHWEEHLLQVPDDRIARLAVRHYHAIPEPVLEQLHRIAKVLDVAGLASSRSP